MDVERGVTGVAEWFHHEQIAIDGSEDTIASLRKGIEFGQPRKPPTKLLGSILVWSPAEQIREQEVVSGEDPEAV